MKKPRTTFVALIAKLCVRDFHPVIAGVILASAVALLVSASTPVRAGSRGNVNPRVHPPNSTPYGKTYGEWAARYWQWLTSFTPAESPAFEQGDVVFGAEKQSGPVWILESGNIGVWDRNVHVPLGKGILFSFTGTECDSLSPPDSGFYGGNEEELLAGVLQLQNFHLSLSGEVDGVPILDIERYLVISPLFDFTYPEGGFGTPGPGIGMAQGWFIVLAPLSKGQHTIHVHADIVEFAGVTADRRTTSRWNDC